MIQRANHVGISVSFLEQSMRFYQQAFGMHVVVERTFERGTEAGRYEMILGLEGATGRVALLRVEGMQLELFEFARPVPKRSDPQRPVCDHGITHFCVEVDDIAAAYDRLKAAGASFHCPPLEFSSGEKATYARDPDGNVIEVLQMNPAIGTHQ